MVEIKGLEKLAPKDFPGYISATVFTGGCNFRCPYCHNSQLVLEPETIPSFPFDFFLNFLDTRKGWLEAVCISGGEPLIHEDIAVLFKVLKERNLLVKLDTNGSFPSRLKSIMEDNLVDFVAVDVKAPWDKYRNVTGSDVDPLFVQESVEIIKDSDLEYVFRTTVVPGLVTTEDIQKIGEMLQGSQRFCLQQYVPKNTIDKVYQTKVPYNQEKFQEFTEIAEKYFSEVTVEGV